MFSKELWMSAFPEMIVIRPFPDIYPSFFSKEEIAGILLLCIPFVMEYGLAVGSRDNATDEGFDFHLTYHLFWKGLRL